MRLAALMMAALVAQSASADDRSPTSETQYASDWSGAYIGAFGGWGISSGRAVLAEHSGALIPRDVEYGLFPRSIKRNSTSGVVGFGATKSWAKAPPASDPAKTTATMSVFM